MLALATFLFPWYNTRQRPLKRGRLVLAHSFTGIWVQHSEKDRAASWLPVAATRDMAVVSILWGVQEMRKQGGWGVTFRGLPFLPFLQFKGPVA